MIGFVANFDDSGVHVAGEKFEIHARNVSTVGEPFVGKQCKDERKRARRFEPTIGSSVPSEFFLPARDPGWRSFGLKHRTRQETGHRTPETGNGRQEAAQSHLIMCHFNEF